MYENVRYMPLGETSVVMELGNEIDEKVNGKIRHIVDKIDKENLDYIIDILPTYRSILITYDPYKISYEDIVKKLKTFEAMDVKDGEDQEVRLVYLPTLYKGEYGPDIEHVAEYNKLTVDEVVKIHTSTDYLVYMLGFIPGFTYLGGMSKKIATPRLESPRAKIEAGSVGIAGTQTGTYPSDSPGGWQIIGRTPLNLFDSKKEPPVFINAGDYIRYVEITEEEFNKIKKQVENDTYEPKIEIVKRSELHGQC